MSRKVEELGYKIKKEEVSIDPTVKQLLEKAEKEKIQTVWDRFLTQQPQCGFGLLGICCRNCNMGPCIIDPFGYGPSKGVCGATADTIVARNLLRMIAAGAAAHSDHAREVALVFKEAIEGKAPYKITDEEKLKSIASKLGVKVKGRSSEEIAKDIAEIALRDFGKQDPEVLSFAKAYAHSERLKKWKELGVLPRGIDREIVEIMHRTHMGVDADPVNLLLQGVRASLGDGYGGSLIATELQDVLFGTPTIKKSYANLGVLEEEMVNIIVHGHVPILSEKVVEWARKEEMIKLANSLGAKGINVAGICCTGNEVLMRQGVPIAGNFLQQELALITGAIEAMVVDYQCIMPSLADIASCYHTKLITTMPIAKIPGATHIEFSPEKADDVARQIVEIAIKNYVNRKKDKVLIPKEKMEAIVGFSVEAILKALGGSLDPLIKLIKDGTIRGAVGIVGCNNPKVKHDYGHIELTRKLIKNNILIVGTGCWAITAAKHGLLKAEAASLAGDGLRKVCESLGIPPCLHMGSCVDCTRILNTLTALAATIGCNIYDLPVAGAAPEWYSEKATPIGTYFVATGVLTVLGTVPPVLGGPIVTKVLTQDVERLLGGKFVVEPDPIKAADIIIEHIENKRKKLGLRT